MDLKDYKKIKKRKELKQTSIMLTKEQLRFLKDKQVNLSKLVRDFLQDLITENKG